MKKIIHKIKNKEYILLEREFTNKDSDEFGRIDKEIGEIGVIEQGIKESQAGFFSSSAIFSYLVPVDKIKEFEEIIKTKEEN